MAGKKPYIVCYDVEEGHDKIKKYLKDDLDAQHAQESVWLLTHEKSAEYVHELLKPYIKSGKDDKDRLLVCELNTCNSLSLRGFHGTRDWLKDNC